ncbi:MAG: response regulator [Cyclobacteriaceae bacterium]|nr:response regulator [Cyclobacteriaceae bacterium]
MAKSILIVDDSESIRELVCSTLEDAGYKVTKGVNGQDGLACLEKMNEDVKLIITDLNMPVMDGIELVKAVRKKSIYKYLPIIILTTETQALKKNEAKAEGATGWIVKPFDKERLLAVIKKVIR